MNSNTIFPLYLLPDLQWFTNYLHSNNYQITINSNYEKQFLFNRFYIKLKDEKYSLSIPVNKIHRGIKLNEVCINYNENWESKVLRTIEFNYKMTPYFDFLMPEIENIFKNKHEKLIELNQNLLIYIFKLLDIPKPEFINSNENLFDLKVYQIEPYFQNFDNFIENLSILDLIFNKGKFSRFYLEDCKLKEVN